MTTTSANPISYIGIDDMRTTFRGLIYAELDRRDGGRVTDVGGGLRPLVPADEVRRRGLQYRVIDISAEETAALDRDIFDVVTGDAADPALLDRNPEMRGAHDLLFSKMVAEHVPDGEVYHRNLFAMAAPGAASIHMFPTLYSAPFLVNWTVPERVSRTVLDAVAARELDKFPARYSWCKGPSPLQLERIRSLGWEVERYLGVMGHEYYRNLPGVRDLHRIATRVTLRSPRPWMTSYAVVQLRKPR